jgi:hypothetical protein
MYDDELGDEPTETEALEAEVARLKAENDQLRATAAGPSSTPAPPVADAYAPYREAMLQCGPHEQQKFLELHEAGLEAVKRARTPAPPEFDPAQRDHVLERGISADEFWKRAAEAGMTAVER